MLTYADMITLLMTFFIVLYSMSKTDVAKFTQITAALERAFNVDVLQGRTLGTATGGEGVGATPSIMESLLTEPEFQSEVARLAARLDAVAAVGDGRAPDVAVGATREGIVIRLSGSYLFDSGRAELKPTARAQLDAIADELRGLPNDIRVEGHTDNIPVDSPRYPTNWELSAARAVAVSRYLVEEGGVPPGRVGAVGYGEFRPVVPNTSQKNRALNRRVEIRLLSSRPPFSPPAAGAAAAGSLDPPAEPSASENRGRTP